MPAVSHLAAATAFVHSLWACAKMNEQFIAQPVPAKQVSWKRNVPMSEWRLPPQHVDFIVNQWIGHDGHELEGFSHRTLDDLFTRYCGLSPQHPGVLRVSGFSKRDRITMVLENASTQELTCLIESILLMLPRGSAEWRTATHEAQIREWLAQFSRHAPVDRPSWPAAPNEAVAPDLRSLPEEFLALHAQEPLLDQQQYAVEDWFASPTEPIADSTPDLEHNFFGDPFASVKADRGRRDFFISHASEDKDFVRQLVFELEARGATVWFDERDITVGDSLSEKIATGLKNSRFGVVVLSKSFFTKQWPRHELKGLVARKMRGEEATILPIWYCVTADDVQRFDPSLTDIKALDACTMSVDQVAESLLQRLRHPRLQQ